MKTMKMMKIRQYVNYTMVCCLLAWGAQFLTSCAESDHMDEYAYNGNGQKTPEKPSSDEITEKLEKIPGISDVTIQYSTSNPEEYGYYFNVEQLKDHKNPKGGTFKQRCFLMFKGYDRPVVLDTEGYVLQDSVDNTQVRQDLVKYLKANYISIEHRYFGTSLPEPFENTDFTYLYTDQAAADLHDIVTLLQKNLLPRTNKWVATGVSKSGITSALYAYYSDKNGWNDIDLFIPFCAPFIKGSQESCQDLAIGYYLANICGSGYPAGSEEAVAYQRLRAMPAAITGNKALRDECLRKFHQDDPVFYKELLDFYEGEKLEKAATAAVINTFYSNLFDHFSYIQFSSWAKYVPDPAKATAPKADISDIYAVTDFVFLKDNELTERIQKDKDKQKNARRAPYDDKSLLAYRETEPSMPYYLQSYRELGSYSYDFSLVDGTYLTKALVDEVGYLQTTEYLYSKRYSGQWDGGKLMTDVHKWAATTTTQPIIFVYSYNDPWTASGIDDAVNDPARKVWKVTNLIGTHLHAFLDQDKCDEKASKAIKDAINTVLGM
jgi:hypothetical protein